MWTSSRSISKSTPRECSHDRLVFVFILPYTLVAGKCLCEEAGVWLRGGDFLHIPMCSSHASVLSGQVSARTFHELKKLVCMSLPTDSLDICTCEQCLRIVSRTLHQVCLHQCTLLCDCARVRTGATH